MDYLSLFLDNHTKDLMTKINTKRKLVWHPWMTHSEYGRRDYYMWLEKHRPNNYGR